MKAFICDRCKKLKIKRGTKAEPKAMKHNKKNE